MKKIAILSDMHIGHKTGICPPDWYGGGRAVVNGLAKRWEWFENSVKENGPYEGLVVLGDTVDGAGVKNGAETIMNTNQQQDAGAYVVDMVKAKTKYMVYGTEVHVQSGYGHELEYGIARQLGIKIHKQIWVGVDGYILDCRHHPAGISRVYPGNPLQKEYETNQKWAKEGVQPEASHIIRGHTHSMYNVSIPNRWEGIACPALQDIGGRFGARLSNIVHFGWGFLTVEKGKWPRWTVQEMPRQKERVFKL